MNRLVTRLILAFAGLSLVATLWPLIPWSPAATAEVLERSQSLVVYGAFLMVFAFLVFPGFVVRDLTRGIAPWVTVAAYVLIFSAIPLVFTAYISGVSAAGLVRVALLCSGALAVPLCAARWLGHRGPAVSRALFAVFGFVLPGWDLYLRSVGRPSPRWISTGPWHWLHRLGAEREVLPLWPFVLGVAVLGAILCCPRPGRSRTLASVGMFVAISALLGAGWGPWVGTDGARVRAVLPSGVRPGLRVPLEVSLPPAADGAATQHGRVSLGLDAVRVPEDGQWHTVLVTLGPGSPRVRIASSRGTEEQPLDLVAVPDTEIISLWVGEAGPPEGWPNEQKLAAAAVPLQFGALEALDVVGISERDWGALGAEPRDAVERWVTLGGHLLVTTEGDPGLTWRGAGWVRTLPPSLGAIREALDNVPPGGPGALDDDLARTFAPPRWREMDLTALLVFAVVYHGAFLLAFLLPLVFDSRKSPGVYLASVGFVVVVVAAVSWNVLGKIFLRDNQVYTHAISLLVADGSAEPRVALRQFLCFASMSQETRDLRFPEDTDLSVYRTATRSEPVIRERADDLVLSGTTLDRFQRKLVVRVDGEGPLPYRCDRVADGFRWKSDGRVPDLLGLRSARLKRGWVIREGRVADRLRWEGETEVLAPAGASSPEDFGPEATLYLGKLLGHFAPASPDVWLLLEWEGLPRRDLAREWLWDRDLGAFLLLPAPGG